MARQLQRIAVGDHLILGGDNLDLALAHVLEPRLTASATGTLSPRQWDTLVRVCCHVKETFLGARPPDRLTVSVPGAGTRLIGGALYTEVERQEVEDLLLEGFLPYVERDVRPRRYRSGFQEFGLPYAPDPAITAYLAAFLSDQQRTAAGCASWCCTTGCHRAQRWFLRLVCLAATVAGCDDHMVQVA